MLFMTLFIFTKNNSHGAHLRVGPIQARHSLRLFLWQGLQRLRWRHRRSEPSCGAFAVSGARAASEAASEAGSGATLEACLNKAIHAAMVFG